jgi:hypothetical protein
MKIKSNILTKKYNKIKQYYYVAHMLKMCFFSKNPSISNRKEKKENGTKTNFYGTVKISE